MRCCFAAAGAGADPLEGPESSLGSSRRAPASARDAIARGFSKLLSGRRQAAEVDWASQLSSRGMGTPRSWAEDSGGWGGWVGWVGGGGGCFGKAVASAACRHPPSLPSARLQSHWLQRRHADPRPPPLHCCAGARPPPRAGMQRTRAESSLQRSIEQLEEFDSPSVGPAATATTASTGGASRYFNTPRGRLLQTLAAEAAAAQKERSLRETREALPLPPTYSSVLGAVDAALQSAGTSPSKIPRLPSSARGGGTAHATAMEGAVAAKLRAPASFNKSPSRIPRPAALGIPPAPRHADENLGSAPASPDKDLPAASAGSVGRFAGALRSSIENLRGLGR